ncbi:MAG TPA: RpiB/LacA/LacB family sugar-phosphate isomerase [Clostridiaceae bacterium]|nr:RpiB/LacA/LacB family sugar-phosphate isomerase [Clostridiaceae bacterium]
MRIAYVNEYSQAPKNQLIFDILKDVVKVYGHEIVNYGQYSPEDDRLTYNEVGLINALILNGKAADFVITTCGTGMGVMLASNSFPGVVCGHAQDPSDTFLFSQINGGNAIAIPLAKGFGWGGEENVRYMFEKLFIKEPGIGYPPGNEKSRKSQQYNAKVLNKMKTVTHRSMLEILDDIDKEVLDHVLRRKSFRQQYLADCKDEVLKAKVIEKIQELKYEI